MNTLLNVLLIILAIVLVALVVLYFLGRKMEKRQVEQQQMLEAAAQTVSMLIIDKKKLKIKDAGLPKIVSEQTPWYMKWARLPIVKAKVVVSGLYITAIKSVRGGAVPAPPKKKGFFAGMFKKDKDKKK